ncbi:GGDEF domain-containing protein [Chitinibacter bivalviorum]|uniref:GGDEF domain-containing protein n=1 Tax=Chitinibacter bivalviorum TaxID=2739434 RepID=A0A7H9BID8_9NEIS|nr:GGDEF domain-containing protein [Chitinibacter bivalviorum]QLG88395.1 GGDEF domain-containing protein [Chitinibacter bivalviorum]
MRPDLLSPTLESPTELAALRPNDEGLQRHSARVKRERRLQREHLALSLACLSLLLPLLLLQLDWSWWQVWVLPLISSAAFFRAAWALHQEQLEWELRLVTLAVVLPIALSGLWAWQMKDAVPPSALILPFVLPPVLLLLAGLPTPRYALAALANAAVIAGILTASVWPFLPCAAALLVLALVTVVGINVVQRLQSHQMRLWTMRQRVSENAEKMAERNQKMRKLAFEDPLTGLSNRLDLINKLRQILKNPHEEAINTVVFLIDLDFFKNVNDEYGHAAGDALLIEIARRFRALVRKGDLVCRLGGDEFVIMFRGISSKDEITLVADKILAKLAEPVWYKDQLLPLGGSIGIAPWEPDLRSPASWLQQADGAMYQAKAGGRNRYMMAGVADTPIEPKVAQ